MIKKITIIKKEDKHLIPRGSTSSETNLIAKVLTDLCIDNDFVINWFKDNTSFEYEGNCSTLTKKDDKMIFESLYYDQEDPLDIFTCSRESFIKLIDQWNSARKENKEFIILELDEKDKINLYATDKIPDSYEPPPPVSSSFFDLVEENFKKRKSMKIEDIELVEIKKIKKSHQTYEQLFKGHQTIMKKSFFPSGWTR
ncbi:hypothetical protein K9K77_03295, partial [Candidatus Babeliales bacterium]|nr:hypothetical protein [Candidatus Babeliales bacterium]